MKLQFDIPKADSSIIKVIGVGGGGSNAVNHMYHQGIKGVDFIVCNTDAQALETSPVPYKIQIGDNLTEGRGAGSNPEVGRKAALESIEEIKAMLANNTKMVFVTAGMGGGTGTGAAPVIAKTAKEMGILTVAIVTSPFSFEGPSRKNKAAEGLENLKKNVDTILVINNNRLLEIYKDEPISKGFSHADNILATGAKGIAEIITVAGYINVDFEDVKTVMANSGVAIMGSAAAEGDDRAREAVEGALDSPLLSESNIQGASHILLNITSGVREVTMKEIEYITNHIQEEAGLSADLIWGNCYDETLGEKIMVTLIATGFETKPAEPEKKVVSLDDKIETPSPVNKNAAGTQKVIWEQPEIKKSEEPVLKSSSTEVETMVLTNPRDKKRAVLKSDEGFRFSTNSETIKTPKGLDELEKTPAFKRRSIKLRSIPHSSESNVSRYTLSDDEEENISIKPKNSFLHDNID